MTAPTVPSPAPASPGPGPAPSLTAGTSTWRLRPQGLRVVIGLELRQRVRSKRWYVALGLWFLFLMGMSLLILASYLVLDLDGAGSLRGAGGLAFSLGTLLLVFLQLLVLPALSAGAVNGDRTAGTLATLQATLLSPAEIVAGKVLASWIVGLAFLAAALPSIAPAALLSGASPLYLLRIMVMLALLSLLVTMLGVGLSSLLRRPLGSVVLTDLVVIGAMVILPVIWAASLPMLSVDRESTDYYQQPFDSDWMQVGTAPGHEATVVLPPGSPEPQPGDQVCVAETWETGGVRSEISAPLLWVNPFVLVADMAPQIDPEELNAGSEPPLDLLRYLQLGMRWASDPTSGSWSVHCDPGVPGYPEDLDTSLPGPIWPMGLAAWLLLGGASAATAVLRLRVPMRRIGSGTRIA
ncbi:ABC transporter permease [Brachybacterium phenoliresistens]|uniref:ABC transporter permease n=1 Tax=Brachybacterium phenoliresistens TaxID=396014 RepID=Z9JND9_9MICO|nr:ABC transporter permease [Brachybacterium phenoliresistens]EWS79503.1 ABC transporter permease [Brachybacterium phenoliresistens]